MYIIIILLIGYIIYSKLIANKHTASEQEIPNVANMKLPYKKKEYLLSNAEKSFYGVLNLVLKDEEFSIFAKVRLADLLYLPHNAPDRQVFWNKIQSKHVDFVICDNNHVKPVLAIELDDSSHSYSDRVERDIFVNQALQEAGLSIIRIKASSAYNVNDITQLVAQYIKPVSSQEVAAASEAEAARKEEAVGTNTIPNCPKCGIPMVERTAKRGDKAGDHFYGCSNYPKCREIIEL